MSAADVSIATGQGLPGFTATYSGFVNGDTAANLTAPVTFETLAASNSPNGTYAITPLGGASPNYAIHDVPGQLTIGPTALEPDATHPGEFILAVGNTPKVNRLRFSLQPRKPAVLVVTRNGHPLGHFSTPTLSRIVAIAGPRANHLAVPRAVHVPATLVKGGHGHSGTTGVTAARAQPHPGR